jgi:deoxyribose-phosphate aldolase
MGSRTKNRSDKTLDGRIAKKIKEIENILGENDITLFQFAVRLEAIVKLLIEKGLVTQEEFQEKAAEVFDFYKSSTAENTTDEIQL